MLPVKPTQIEIMPCAGLANRMRAIASAAVVAKEYGAKLVIGWKWDYQIMTGNFGDLFEVAALPSWISVIEMGLAPDPTWNSSPEANSEEAWEVFVATNRTKPVWRFKSWAAFKGAGSPQWIEALQMLRPHWKVQVEVESILFKMPPAGSPRIGVHIRRTDHKKAIETSPSAVFWSKMTMAPDTAIFYVASDSDRERQEARSRFGVRVITGPEDILGRASLEGCRQGLIDFFCLAACDEIWGSYGSSFGILAAAYGGAGYADCSTGKQVEQSVPAASGRFT